MPQRSFRPRLSSIDLFAGALLTALVGGAQAGCGGDVNQSGSGAGGAGGGGASSSTDATSATTGTTTSSGEGGASATSTTTGTSATTSSGAGGASAGCQNPTPILVAGEDTGFDRCDAGQLLRREAIECPTNYPDTNACCGGCPEGQICSGSGEVACSCVTACTNDSQCGAGQICLCGDPAGTCVPGTCASGSDCAAGQECTSWDATLGCLYLNFQCTTAADTCGGDLDCTAPNSFCAVQPDGSRQCVQGGCAIGRPFLVGGDVRRASIEARGDWRDESPRPSQAGLSTALRAELASAWEDVARMEHASIAAFARFSLQLLALGAPPDLVERTTCAMADETRHARAAFAFATAYSGREVGPGPLRVEGALEGANDLATMVRLVVREGCAGETVAAFEAGEAEAGARDAAVRRVLAGIAGDEAEHAELAWRTLAWALEVGGDEIRGVLAEEIASLEREPHRAEPLGPSDEALFEHGVVTPRRRASIRAEVLSRAVLPCLRALARGAVRAAA